MFGVLYSGLHTELINYDLIHVAIHTYIRTYVRTVFPCGPGYPRSPNGYYTWNGELLK